MVNEKIKLIIAEQLDINPESIKEDSNIVDDLGADSLDIVELLSTLEDEYGVTIPDDKIKDLQTISSIQETLESLIEK